MTLDGSMTGVGSILNSLTTGININTGAQLVTLRGISIQGAGNGTRGISITTTTAGSRVIVENCFIMGQSGNGIDDSRSAGGSLDVFNTTIESNGGAGISANPSSGSTSIHVHLFNCRIHANSGNGILLGSNAQATIFNSLFTQNAVGIFVQQTAGGTTSADVDHCVASNNGSAFQANTSSSIIRVSNTTAFGNTNLAVVVGGGQVSSYGNNQTAGAVFPSTPTGQQ
jgi:hypothetical protein